MKKILCTVVSVFLLASSLHCLASDIDEEVTFSDVNDDLIEENLYDDVEWNFPVDLSAMDPEYVILANKEMLLSKKFVPDDLITIKKRKADKSGVNTNNGMLKASSAEMQLQRICAEALVKMSEDARKDGIYLYLKSAYRSYKTQKTMYHNRLAAHNGKDDGWVQMEGASDHQTGLGCDVIPKSWLEKSMNEKMAAEEECKWMAAHCHEYGFIIRYPEGKEELTGVHYEPWHLRYVGTAAAAYIMENGLCLEEFHDQLQQAIQEFLDAGGNPSVVEPFIQVSADNS